MPHFKSLIFLLNGLTESPVISDLKISHLTNNSRDVRENTLFIAYPGEKVDGRQYISDAIKKGAIAVAYEPSGDFTPTENIPHFPIKNLKTKQSTIAARFYDFPSAKIPVIGVTGTNGKTSVTYFIAQCLENAAIIGTTGYGFLSNIKKTANTTPDGLQLQALFSELENKGAKTIAMEVSSHALYNERVNNDIQFHAAIFTNLTQDHLDFHKTMENYRAAKELLFRQLTEAHAPARAKKYYAVINIDDDTGKYFTQQYRDKLNVITYSLRDKNADILASQYTLTENGFDITLKTNWGAGDFHLPLIGEFNIHNALATFGALITLNIPFEKIIQTLSQLKTVPGRMQLLHAKNKPNVIVDYAHTPDALEKALQGVRKHCSGKLICVFGCGGDRDKTKRPKMGAIADQLADYSIITNDNPRSENPETIANEIIAGMKKSTHAIELDRANAIKKAIEKAGKRDWVLIAGKGHETEQIIGDQHHHHSDVDCVAKILVS